MSGRLFPALVAVGAGLLLALVLLTPYVAVAYRRRGGLSPGRALLALAALVYALAVVAYAVLPLPQVTPGFCAHGGVAPQLDPWAAVHDAQRLGAGSPRALLGNAAVVGAAFNVAFFVPLGMLVRHLRGTGVVATTVVGLGVSLLVETTQLTGDWSAYPCAYRLFDVDDVVTNTAGALLGAALAPLLALVPDQDPDRPVGAPRPVTAARRLLALAADATLVATLAGVVGVGAALLLALYAPGRSSADAAGPWGPSLTWGVPALVELVAVMATGSSAGDLAVRLRPRRAGSAGTGAGGAGRVGRIGPGRRLVVWLLGAGGWCLLQTGSAPSGSRTAGLLAAVVLVAVFTTRGHRGLGAAVAGLDVVDERAPATAGRRA